LFKKLLLSENVTAAGLIGLLKCNFEKSNRPRINSSQHLGHFRSLATNKLQEKSVRILAVAGLRPNRYDNAGIG